MGSLAKTATRSIILYGSRRISSTLPTRNSSSSSPSDLAKMGKEMARYACGGPQRCTCSACVACRTLSSHRRSFCVAATKPQATIKVGEKLPEAELSYLDDGGNVKTVKVSELVNGKKVVLFGVPAAFSPTCSAKQMPAFVAKADEIRARGIDVVACVSVNDAFVQKAWGESLGVGDKVKLLSDGNSYFTKALGVQHDMSGMGMGLRSRRYALLADNGVVRELNLEEGGAYTVSGPDEILKVLPEFSQFT